MQPRCVKSPPGIALTVILLVMMSGCGGATSSSTPISPAASSVPASTEVAAPTPTGEHDISSMDTVTPTEQAETVSLPKGVLYHDDFTDPNTGWPNAVTFDNYYIGYHEPNHYHVEVHVPRDRAIVAVPKKTFTDFTVEVKALVEPNNTAKTGDFRYGIVFRRTGNEYYAFTVSARTRTWYVLKSSPSGVSEVKKGNSDAIQGLTTDDVLRVDAKGPDFFFAINGQPVDQESDADYAGGEIGFYVETFDSSRVHIHYGGITISQVAANLLPKGVLYHDDFTDPNTGWPNAVTFDNYYIGYHEPNHYHVEVHVPKDRAIVAVPKQSFTDFSVETRVTVEPNNTAKTGDFRYGLVFRRTGNEYYAFAVSARSKTWYVLKSSASGLAELRTGTSDAIQGLTTDDILRVDAQGPRFYFHINGQRVDEENDADYTGGGMGFYVETFDSQRVHMHYGEITVREPDVPQQQCTVVSGGLNLREGPGTNYNIIGSVTEGAQLEPLGRSADGNWINVRPAGSAQPAWVSAAAIYVMCTMPVADLPVRD